MSDTLDRLHASILGLRKADPADSRTARLIQAGRGKIAKKLAEEAVEVVIDAMRDDREAVIRESADLLYHLVVLWAASGIPPQAIWDEMAHRERMLGLAEKLPKNGAKKTAVKMPAGPDLPEQPSRRKVVPLASSRLRNRR